MEERVGRIADNRKTAALPESRNAQTNSRSLYFLHAACQCRGDRTQRD